MARVSEHNPCLRCSLLLEGIKRVLCLTTVLPLTFNGCESGSEIALNLLNQKIVPLNLFSEECVEGFLTFNRDLILIRLEWDLVGHNKDDLLQLAAEVFVDLSIASIGLDLGERRLFRTLDHELVDIGPFHDVCCDVSRCPNRGVVGQAENLWRIL